MKRCLLCGQYFIPQTSFLRIFFWSQFHEKCICYHCLARFEPLPKKRCKVCNGLIDQNSLCLDCRNWQKLYGAKKLLYNHSLYLYNEAVHDLMVNYKRYGDYELHKVLQELCADELNKYKADLYIPVPTSPEHMAQRQFDTVSSIYGDLLPLTAALNKKPGQTAQGEKNRNERLKSQQSFFINKNLKIDFHEYKILLLDDIYTTGRTLYHARDALTKIFPNAVISSFSIYR